MNAFLKAIAIAALLTPAVYASDNADVSLEREVDRYLEQSASRWDSEDTLRAFFKKGLNFETADGNFKMKIFGRLMWDSFWGDSDDVNFSSLDVSQNASFFRRIRLGVSGTVYKKTVFKLQMDFGKGSTAIRDVYVGLKQLPGNATLKLGNFFEPFSLQELTSSKFILVMERSTIVNAFAPGRHTGLMLSHVLAGERVTVAYGLFWGESDSDGAFAGNGGGAFTIRVTGVAHDNKDQQLLIHVGVGFSLRDVTSSKRFRARPGTGDKERLVDTGSISAEEYTLIGFEFALIWRSLSLSAEYMMADVDAASSGDPTFGGFYVEIGWWITGEHPRYKKSAGSFSRVSPKRSFHGAESGPGAWQVVVRYDTVDLNDALVTGGEMDTIIFGVNWHWNPNTRVMFNAIFADVDSGPEGAGDLTVVQIRVQVDF